MKQKDILIFIIPASILVLAWIIFNIYHNSVTSTIPERLNIQILPIKPSFDMLSVNKLKQRKTVNPVYQIQTQVSPSPTPFAYTISSQSASQNTGSIINTPQTPAGGISQP